jgi:hypothetical protein
MYKGEFIASNTPKVDGVIVVTPTSSYRVVPPSREHFWHSLLHFSTQLNTQQKASLNVVFNGAFHLWRRRRNSNPQRAINPYTSSSCTTILTRSFKLC